MDEGLDLWNESWEGVGLLEENSEHWEDRPHLVWMRGDLHAGVYCVDLEGRLAEVASVR